MLIAISVRCSIVETAVELEAALALRYEVFVVEQGVAPELELDEFDTVGGKALHAVASHGVRLLATGRLRPVVPGVGKLERLAVLVGERGKGVGRALTRYLETVAQRQGMTRVMLHAQDSARGFYEKLGYASIGEPFVEAGIEHIAMSKDLI